MNFIEELKEEMVLALGCTEPIAISLAAAKAREVLGEVPDQVLCTLSGNVIKNARSVTIPNSGGEKGLELAAALGIIAGQADKKLEVLAGINQEDLEKAKAYKDKIRVERAKNCPEVYVKVWVKKGENEAFVVISEEHTNISQIEKNGQKIKDSPLKAMEDLDNPEHSMHDILDFVNTFDFLENPEITALIQKQIDHNWAIAEEGIQSDYGASIGRTIIETEGDNARSRAKAYTAAASDARMAGCTRAVMINAGSGNQGITVSVPIISLAKSLKVEDDKLFRALLLSNLTGIHQKKFIGKLSAFCGALSAAAAAGAGIAYLLDFRPEEIFDVIKITLTTGGGMVCDGAKASCAGKVALSVENGLMAVDMVSKQRNYQDGDGLVKESVDETIENIGRLAKQGMKQTDEEIIDLMIG